MAKANATGHVGQSGNKNVGTYSTYFEESPVERRLRPLVNRSHGSRKLKATLVALIGAAPGASDAYSNTRVAALSNMAGNPIAGGGLRTVETVAYQTGVTTSADATRIKNQIQKRSRPATYPVNLAGWKPGNIGKLV